ncbi:MAG: tetratricopeptide repeat protein [Bacteroidota bacterium]|nr:tetratricopeptide repeat protein [Bacteroidota bacterium]
MNRPIFGVLSWLCGIGLLMGSLFPSCTGHGNVSPGEDSVLHQPPYSGLTDSIRQAKPSGPGGPGRLAGLYFRRGELLSQNNLHEMAAEDFRKSLELRRDEVTALRYAQALSITGHSGEAIGVLQEAVAKFPGNDKFPRLLADLYRQSGRPAEARALYDKMLRTDSLNFEAWYERGLLLEKAGDTAGAIADLKRAYGLQPVNTYALELAHLYAEKGNSLALSLCDEVLRKDSTRELLDPLFIKGIYYSNTRQENKAIAQFDSCISRDWKFTDAYLEKGIILFRRKQIAQALETFKMTVTVSNTYPDGYYWIGRCLEAEGKDQEAVIYYQQALALDKEFTEAADRIKKLK